MLYVIQITQLYSIFRSYGIVKYMLVLFYQNDNIFKPFFILKSILSADKTIWQHARASVL